MENTNMKLRRSALSVCLFLGVTIGGVATADLGNRYGLPQIYQSEISAAEANVVTSHDRGNKSGNAFAGAVIIDVRRVSEHLSGHPPKSYSIPFPHVEGSASMPMTRPITSVTTSPVTMTSASWTDVTTTRIMMAPSIRMITSPM